MAEVYRVEIKYTAEPITSLTQSTSSDFERGAHGIIWLHIDERRWFTPGGDTESARLATGQFGASSGELAWVDGGNVDLRVRGKTVGTFNLATLKRINLEGVIATRMVQQPAMIPGTGPYVFTEGLFFRRPAVWADKSFEAKLGVLLERAQKYAHGEVGTLIQNLKNAVPVVVAIMLLLAALGALAGPAVAGVVGVIALCAGYIAPRSIEYAAQLKVFDEVMRASNPSEGELEQGARAVAEFFRLVVEDVAFALVMKAGEATYAKVKAKSKQGEAVESVDEAFTRHDKEEFDRAAKQGQKKKAAPRPEGATYTREQLEVASEHAFKDFPLFRNRRYSELKEWLIRNGFVWQKKAIFEKDGRNSNAGGSEILVRRSPDLEKAGLCEVVRIDEAGHNVRFKDGPVRDKVVIKNGKGEVVSEREGWGGLRHFHKDVVPIAKLRTYCEQFVPNIRSVNDFNNMIEPGSRSMFQQIHIEIRSN